MVKYIVQFECRSLEDAKELGMFVVDETDHIKYRISKKNTEEKEGEHGN